MWQSGQVVPLPVLAGVTRALVTETLVDAGTGPYIFMPLVGVAVALLLLATITKLRGSRISWRCLSAVFTFC